LAGELKAWATPAPRRVITRGYPECDQKALVMPIPDVYSRVPAGYADHVGWTKARNCQTATNTV
jgi:hypothetical protein